jgi:hypothetical protein
MTTSTKSRKATKTVQVISRVEFKADPRKVVYICRSSNGTDIYQTTLFDGKATGCQCPSHKPCYHMTGCEAKEAARNPFTATPCIDTCATCGGNHNTNDHAWAMLSMAERQAEIDRMHAVTEAEAIVTNVTSVVTEIDDSYEAWKRENDVTCRLSREAYIQEFSIY